MSDTYERLGLGEHPYGLTGKEREERRVHLLQMQEALEEEIQQTTMTPETKRLKHQKKLVTKRLELLDNVDLTEKNIIEKTEPVVFSTNITFSPELKAAILKFGHNGSLNFHAANEVARKYNVEQASAIKGMEPVQGKMDLRDFAEMIEVPPGAEEQEINAYATEYAEDYMNPDGNPELKKARLDEFYDRIDAIDPFNLDFSCLTGNDKGERSGPDHLTPSERDFMKLMVCFRSDQAFQSKEIENQAYFDARYADPRARVRMRLTQGFLFDNSFMQYLWNGVLVNNALDQKLEEIPENRMSAIEEMRKEDSRAYSPAEALAPQVGMQIYKQDMSVLLGKPCDMAIRFQIPEGAAEELYAYGKPDMPNAEFQPDGFYFEKAFGFIFTSAVAKEYMAETGLEFGDMIYIDGVSIKETLEKEHPGIAENGKINAMKHLAMKAVMSGEHRVEFARIQRNEKGSYSMNISMVEPNLHELDDLERTREHTNRSGLFGFLRGRKETRAELADKLWANDPERESRQSKIRDTVNKKIMAAVNKKEREKAVQRAAEKMDFNKLMSEFEEIDELNYKYDKSLAAQRERLKAAIQHSKDACVKNDRAFFGWMADGNETMTDADLQKAINTALPNALSARIGDGVHMTIPVKSGNGRIREVKTDNTVHVPLKTMDRFTSRSSIVALYAMTLDEPWKMTLDEVLSDDPALNQKKAEIGKKFVEDMRIMGTAEFFEKNGKDADYEAYFAKRNTELYARHVKMFDAIENQPWALCQDTGAAGLAQNYEKIEFLTHATQDWHQVLTQPVRQVNEEALEAMEDRNRAIGAVKNIKVYAQYVASDEFLNSTAEGKVFDAYIARICMEDLKERCREIQSLKEIYGKTGKEVVEKAVPLLQERGNMAITPNRLKDMGDYIRTGKNPVHEGSKFGEIQWKFPSEIPNRKKTAGKVK